MGFARILDLSAKTSDSLNCERAEHFGFTFVALEFRVHYSQDINKEILR